MSGIAIRAVTCLIPGYGLGAEYGELLSTRDVLENSTDVRSLAGKVDGGFVAVKLGIESVATTHTTAEVCRELWAGGEPAGAATRYAGYTNSCLFRMLAEAIRRLQSSLSATGRTTRVRFHIHIVTYPQPSLEYDLSRVRREIGIDDIDLHSLVIQQGCAGLFSALKTARSLLADPVLSADDVVLITAENNMMPFVHQRTAGYADFTDLDSWLFPTIFGEGVGAMAVGRATEENGSNEWKVETLRDEMVEREWRVAPRWNAEKGCSGVVVRSRAVKQTYLTHVAELARQGIAECGGQEAVFRLCLHESNPLLVKAVANAVHFPLERTPTISSTVGTLAIVSSFSLLALAMQSASSNVPGRNKVVTVLIGETSGIRAGLLTLAGPHGWA